MGKSRLVEEFLRSAAVGGDGIIAVTVPAGGRDAPGGVARAVLEGLAGAPGLGAAAPDALATVVALAPGIGRRFLSVHPDEERPAQGRPTRPGEAGTVVGAASAAGRGAPSADRLQKPGVASRPPAGAR